MTRLKNLGANVLAAVVGVPLVILLVVCAVPIWLYVAVTGKGRTVRRSREEVAMCIEDFLAGTGGQLDWDDFLSIPIEDPELEQVRQECEATSQKFPPAEPGMFCGAEGLAAMRRLAAGLRSTAG